jgi:hypothetical protein
MGNFGAVFVFAESRIRRVATTVKFAPCDGGGILRVKFGGSDGIRRDS